MGKNRKRNALYVGTHSKKMGMLSLVSAGILLMAAMACMTLAVLILLDNGEVSDDVFFEFAYPVSATSHASDGNASGLHVVPLSELPELPNESGYISSSDGYTPGFFSDEPPVESPFLTLPTQPSPFSALSYYIPENAEAYEYFQVARPDLDVETIVWKVNVSLHLPFYTGIQINYEPRPLLITPFFRLPPGFSPDIMIPVNSSYCSHRATPETVAAFRLMREAAWLDNIRLTAVSAFRSAARQSALWERGGRRDGAVARPYHSEHQTGRALDLGGPDGRLLDSRGPTPTGIWVAENAHEFGFIVRYRAETTHITGYIHEPWHITYVGLDISMYMYNNNILSLEEFVGRNPGTTLN